MTELRKDPKVIASAQKRLVPGERVLWAAKQPGLGRRGLMAVATVALWLLAVWGLFSLTSGGGVMILWLAMTSPFLLWWAARMLRRYFLATDRRVIFISPVWPTRWSYWNYSEMDVHWVRHGMRRNVIDFKPFARGRPMGKRTWEVYPTDIEGVPDIEILREIILAQIANNPIPVDEEHRKGPRPSMPGTRTG